MKNIILFAALILAPLAGLHAAANPKPNIILIFADDLGYMDIGANNPKTFYETPNIDALAAKGMRFKQGYAACLVCSPTRASIMTGKYPPRVGITDFIPGMRSAKLLSAPNANHLALEETTIAEALRDAGYTNFFAGKWHLGDGQPDSYELMFGTNSASSRFTATSYNNSGNIGISFPSVSGRNYRVEFNNELTDSTWQTLQTITATSSVTNFTDPAVPAPVKRFYRVQAL